MTWFRTTALLGCVTVAFLHLVCAWDVFAHFSGQQEWEYRFVISILYSCPLNTCRKQSTFVVFPALSDSMTAWTFLEKTSCISRDIARNSGHFAPVINCQRNLISKMADKNDRSQGKRIPCDFLNNLSSVDLFYEEKSWNKTPCKKMLGLYSAERLIATKQYAAVPFVTFSWQFCFKAKPGRLIEDFWMPGT